MRGCGVPAPGNPAFGTSFFRHLLPRPDHFQGMRQVCAWCHEEIGANDERSLGRVSHGMCRTCRAAKIAALPATGLAQEPDRGRAPRQLGRVLEAAPFALA